jgi:hypothetical protein
MSLIVDGTNGVTFNDSSLQGAAASPYVLKNRIINGDMRIDQRNAGASVTPTNGQYLVDRFFYGASQASKFTAQQNAGSVTPPVGFTNYLGFTSTSAYTVGASERFNLFQSIEGFNVSDLAWGTANAKTITLSFQVYSSLTGTFGGTLNNSAYNRSYPFTYSIPVANTWTSISVTIAGDTTGTWLTNNGSGINVLWGLGVGSTISGTAGSWSSNSYFSATGATSVVGTNGATFYITGVQLEVGSTATPFERRMYTNELALCQRYFYAVTSYPQGNIMFGNIASSQGVVFKSSMRSAPTLSTVPTASYSVTGGVAGTPGLSPYNSTTTEVAYFYNSANNWSVGYQAQLTAGLTAEL